MPEDNVKPAPTPAPKTEKSEARVVESKDKAKVDPVDEPTRAEKELAELGVDPRLDNRTGKDRPELVEWPAKPQQVDPEHPEDAEKFVKPSFPPAGAHSEGPHGLGAADEKTKD